MDVTDCDVAGTVPQCAVFLSHIHGEPLLSIRWAAHLQVNRAPRSGSVRRGRREEWASLRGVGDRAGGRLVT
ncbi:hypothetical protein AMK15_34310 [Streptomyces sp. MJM1172]|nr:hypothetical protein AMK15_34310 [Streptomyces sp. MJM1172]